MSNYKPSEERIREINEDARADVAAGNPSRDYNDFTAKASSVIFQALDHLTDTPSSSEMAEVDNEVYKDAVARIQGSGR